MTAPRLAHSQPSELLQQLARSTPRLPGAACRDHRDLFDHAATREHGLAAMRTARTEALAVCHSCPALLACRRWLYTLEPASWPRGVVAGRVVRRSIDA